MVRHIKHWPLDKLIPYAESRGRTPTPRLRRSPPASPSSDFNNPILVDTKAGIIAGHGRLLAARKLGLREVPVIVLDHLSESQKRAYVIADNQLAENAGWDDELLRSNSPRSQEENFDVD